MTEGQGGPHLGMRVGASLREHRVRARLALDDVATAVHVRPSYLQAIEDSRYQDLPAMVYATGFVRAYAEQVGLDPEDVVRRFRSEMAGRTAAVPLHFPAPPAEAETPKGGVLLLGAAIALIAYAAWYMSSGRDAELADAVPPLPPQLEHLATNVRPEPGGVAAPSLSGAAPGARPPLLPEAAGLEPLPAPAPSARTAVPAAEAVPQPPSVAHSGAEPGNASAGWPAADMLPRDDGAVPLPVLPAAELPPPSRMIPPTPQGTQPGRDAMAAEPPATTAAPASALADGAGRIVLRARTDSWVEVRDAESGAPVTARLLRAGDVYAVPDRPGLKLVTGNAGGLLVEVDGQPAPPLGRDGAVRRGIPLDAEVLRRGLDLAMP